MRQERKGVGSLRPWPLLLCDLQRLSLYKYDEKSNTFLARGRVRAFHPMRSGMAHDSEMESRLSLDGGSGGALFRGGTACRARNLLPA